MRILTSFLILLILINCNPQNEKDKKLLDEQLTETENSQSTKIGNIVFTPLGDSKPTGSLFGEVQVLKSFAILQFVLPATRYC